jgi:DnaJ-class molecular chaperone
MKDHYRVLQVTRDAETEVIERAYKALSRKYHPDLQRGADSKRATRKMQEINAAYSVLKDASSRRRYDLTLPAEGAQAWDVFWERGLVGMFMAKFIERH